MLLRFFWLKFWSNCCWLYRNQWNHSWLLYFFIWLNWLKSLFVSLASPMFWFHFLAVGSKMQSSCMLFWHTLHHRLSFLSPPPSPYTHTLSSFVCVCVCVCVFFLKMGVLNNTRMRILIRYILRFYFEKRKCCHELSLKMLIKTNDVIDVSCCHGCCSGCETSGM